MSQGKDDSRRDHTENRSSQHISSIAHLFFDNNNETDSQSTQPLTRHFLVVGTGRDTCAPYTVAGLAHHLLDQSINLEDRSSGSKARPTRQVYFGELSPVCFSALSHLESSTYRLPLAEERVPWDQQRFARGSVLRLFPGPVPSEDFSGGMVDGTFYLRHLDLPRESELQALETQFLSSQTTSLGNDGADALLWCVRAPASSGLALTGRLGRLLRVVRPRIIHLLVFGGPGHGQNKSQTANSSQSGLRALDQSKRLLEYVSGELSVESRFMAVSTEERAFQLSSLARQLSLSQR